ncbi:MAG TPA: hypothetical protein DC058_09750 [Planctomycetaceae bacterium]|nr:hypothetical protein [Planctomycetaceae bacterium]HBC61488.1 hypothetical protein [Planctomycetaceae bacterium]
MSSADGIDSFLQNPSLTGCSARNVRCFENRWGVDDPVSQLDYGDYGRTEIRCSQASRLCFRVLATMTGRLMKQNGRLM